MLAKGRHESVRGSIYSSCTICVRQSLYYRVSWKGGNCEHLNLITCNNCQHAELLHCPCATHDHCLRAHRDVSLESVPATSLTCLMLVQPALSRTHPLIFRWHQSRHAKLRHYAPSCLYSQRNASHTHHCFPLRSQAHDVHSQSHSVVLLSQWKQKSSFQTTSSFPSSSFDLSAPSLNQTSCS